MKKKLVKIAFGSSVAALVFVVFFSCTNLGLQKEHNETAPKQIFTSTQNTEQEHVAYGERHVQKVVEGDVFPQVGDREQEIGNTTTLQRGVYCPITPEENQYVIDFTNNGTIEESDLVLYANREREDAERSVDNLSIKQGYYTVLLASFFSEGEHRGSEGNLKQQWYLELYDQTGDMLSSSGKTRDIQDNEVQSIELVGHGLRVPNDVQSAKAVHGAYQDSEEQKIIPLCALLTVTEVPVNNQAITLSSSGNDLFTATTLLHYTTEYPKAQHSIYTVFVLLSVLFAISTLSLFSVFHTE